MKSSILRTVILGLALVVGGCRQADGPMPPADGEVPNQLGDMSRDLLAVARNEAEGRKDFSDDLKVFARGVPEGETAAAAFADRISGVVTGLALTEQAAQQLAHACWVVVAGSELSERQVEAARVDLKNKLVEAGVADAESTQVAAEVPQVNKTVSTRHRRWYERF